MREAEDDAVAGITKPGAAAIKGFHVGADFDEAVRDCGSDEGIAAPVHADERVDVAGVILSGLDGGLLRSGSLACKGQREQKRHKKNRRRTLKNGLNGSLYQQH